MNNNTAPELQLASGDYLAVVRDFALSKGINLSTLLKDSEIELQDLINPPPLVTNLIVSHIGVNLFNELEDPITGAIEFGLKMTASTHGSLGIAVQCAADLHQGYEILREFYNTRLAAQDIFITEEREKINDKLVCKNEMMLDDEVQHFFDISTLVTIATNTYLALDKSNIQGTIQINVDSKEPEGFSHETLVGVTILFEQAYLEMLIPIEWKHEPLNIANQEMARVAVKKCESELKQVSPSDLVQRIKKHVKDDINNLPKLFEIASVFNMSPATFKRKLKERNTTYQDIKNEVRLQQASLLISQLDSIENIAERLGFSDASNFTKAFKTWTGLTPKEFREK